jgi:hypothetical protein
MSELQFKVTGLSKDDGTDRERGNRAQPARATVWGLLGVAVLVLFGIGRIVIISPSSGTTTLDAQIAVSGRVTGADTETVALSVNGSTQTLPAPGGVFDVQVPLSPGENIISASANGYASDPITVVRRLQPVIRISSPAANTATTQTQIEVTGVVENSAGGTITFDVNGAATNVGVMGDRFSATVPLAVGHNVIRALLPDASASPAVVEVDRLATGIAITSPSNGYTTEQETVTVIGSVDNSDAPAITLKLNESRRTIALHNGSFAADIVLRLGENRVQAMAGDAASNEIVVTRTLPPVIITLLSPQSGGSTQSAVAPVRGTIQNTRRNEVAVNINGSRRIVMVTGGSFAAEVPLEIGQNVIRASQDDASSNEVVINRLPVPTLIVLISPKGGQTQRPSVRVLGTIANPRGQTVTLEVNDSARTLGVVNGRFASDVALTIGDNRIRASQGDAVSNEVVVNRRALPTLVEITSPKSGPTRSSSVKVIGTVANPQGRSISIAINNSSRSAEIINGGFALDVELAVGDNHIRASQGDAVSNEVVVSRLASPIFIRIISPKSGRTRDSSIRVTGLITNPHAPTITLTVNGSGRTLRIVNNGFASDVQLNMGDNHIQASQGDAVSNEVVVSRGALPTLIEITSPKSGPTRRSSVKVIGTVTNPQGRSLSIAINNSSRSAEIINGGFALDVELAVGDNRIRASQGGVVSNEVVVSRLSSPTSIRIISPQTGRTGDSSVTVTGLITNPHGPTITLTVNGFSRTLRIVNNGFAADVQLNMGDNRIQASQVEAVSNEISLRRLPKAPHSQ